MIEDLALVVQAQHDLVLSIESNIKGVKDFIEQGITSLQDSKKGYMKAQEKFCVILVVSLIIGGTAIVIIMNKLNLF